jgi:hypothetical protein
MSDLHAREATSDEWDGPVVELVEEDRVVGIAYVDGDVLFAEFAPDRDGDAWAFEVSDLQTALDNASAMLLPQGTSVLLEEVIKDDDGEHPVDRLATEFDDLSAHRGEEDEGFYPIDVAARIMARCESLGLAVVSIEGFRLDGEAVSAVPGMSVDTGNAHDGEPWPVFLAGCNIQAMALLERWAREPGLILALEVGDADGERYVL